MKANVTSAEFTTAGAGDGRLMVVVERHGRSGMAPDADDFPPDMIAALAEWLKAVSS